VCDGLSGPESQTFAGCRLPISSNGRWSAACEAMDRNVPRTRSVEALRAALRTAPTSHREPGAPQQLALLRRRSKRPRFGPSIAPSGCGSPTVWWRQASISYAPRPSFAGPAGLRAFWTGSPVAGEWSTTGRLGDAELVRTMRSRIRFWGAHASTANCSSRFLTSRQRRRRRSAASHETALADLGTFSRTTSPPRSSVDFVVPTATFACLAVGGPAASSPPNRAIQRDRFPRRLDRAELVEASHDRPPRYLPAERRRHLAARFRDG